MLPTPDPLPPEVTRRLESLSGGSAVLLFDAFTPDEGRAVVYLGKPGQIPLHVIVHGVHDASWGLSRVPTLRMPWRFASPVRSVRLSMVQLYDPARAVVAGEGAPPKREPIALQVRPPAPIRGVAVTGTSLGVAMHGVPSVPAPIVPPADRAVRLEVQFEGDAPIVLEGFSVTLGPIPPPGRAMPTAGPPPRGDIEALPPLPSWGPRGPVKPS